MPSTRVTLVLNSNYMISWLWLPLALGSAFFAALVAIFGKIGLSTVDSTLATTVRAGIMFLFLVIVAFATGGMAGISQIESKTMVFIVLSGIAGALSWLCYFAALKIGTAPQIASIDRLSVVLVFVLAALFLHEGANWKTALGAILITLGGIIVAFA